MSCFTPFAQSSLFLRSNLSRASAVLLAVLLGSLGTASRLHAQGTPLIENSDFLTDENYDTWPDGWLKAKGLTWHKTPEVSFVRITVAEPGKSPVFYREIPLTAAMKSLDYHIRARATDVISGDDSWHDARIQLEFRNANKAKLRPVPKPLVVSKAGTVDWKTFTGSIEVPPDAASLVVVGALFYCKAGTMDIGMVELKTNE